MTTPSSIWLFIFLLWYQLPLSAGQLPDSILQSLAVVPHDTSKVRILIRVCSEIRNNDPETALGLAREALGIASTYEMEGGKARAREQIGLIHHLQSKYDSARHHFSKALKINFARGDKKNVALCYNYLGAVYDYQGRYEKAVEHYIKCLKIREEIGDKKGIAASLNNLGIVNRLQGNLDKALEYYDRSMAIKKELGDKKGLANGYNNLGIIYRNKGDYDKALENYEKSLAINRELGNKKKITFNLNNLGTIYHYKGEHNKAIVYYEKALQAYTELGAERGIAGCLNNIGSLYDETGRHRQAIPYLEKSLSLSRKIGAREYEKMAYLALAQAYSHVDDFGKAYRYHKAYSLIKDTLYDEQHAKRMSEMEAKYESEQKQKEIELLTKDKALQNLEVKRQRLQKYGLIAGLVLIIALLGILLNRNKIKQRSNERLIAQKQEILDQSEKIEGQRDLLAKQQENILASIRYAKQIQEAILPDENLLKEHLSDFFIYYQPKEIVSGDFYWFQQMSPKKFLLAAADCTGHGVPGAFMSMICTALLNETVLENKISEPAKILDHLKQGIITALKQKGVLGEQKDGMDIALCAFDLENMVLGYAGAYSPLLMVRASDVEAGGFEVQETKGDKMPIGIHYTKSADKFINHTIPLQKNDKIYIFSDGFVDQFGGPEPRKFSLRKFKSLLLDIHHLDMNTQKQQLATTLEDWKKDLDQIDDICVIGVRV